MNDILPAYRSDVARLLNETISVGKIAKEKNWLEVFLAVFILLTCVEMNLQHEASWANRTKCPVSCHIRRRPM
jgi:protein-S-isoprenylcysteine O-methyltransferase Ste14